MHNYELADKMDWQNCTAFEIPASKILEEETS